MNKVLVKLYVPSIDEEFDVFLPVNELIWKINKMLVKSVSDLTGGLIEFNTECVMINVDTGVIYENNTILINTDIRNATKIMLLEV